MRGYAFLAIVIGLLAYVGSRPAAPPSAPATLAERPATTQVPAKTEPRPEPSRTPLARALAPLDISPRTPQPAPQRQPQTITAPTEQPKEKHTAEILTAAAIAALIVAESRRAYHTGGRPCACPDDRMRNGRACGGRSAYSRPGGATPLCYAGDVTDAMIKTYRERQLAAR
ncbi:hypothetical protein ACVILJ_006214 [Bradyrhizobium diazoefficiens]|nr:hypothetical protein BD122_38766 [Bradyrhizobium diazoefficiens]